jgi:hypothetical protein
MGNGYIFLQKMIFLDIILMRFFVAEYLAIRYEDLVDTTTYFHPLIRDVVLFPDRKNVLFPY